MNRFNETVYNFVIEPYIGLMRLVNAGHGVPLVLRVLFGRFLMRM